MQTVGMDNNMQHCSRSSIQAKYIVLANAAENILNLFGDTSNSRWTELVARFFSIHQVELYHLVGSLKRKEKTVKKIE